MKRHIYIEDESKCCGCNVCENICPVQAIKITINERGFNYPSIDDNKCIECGLCIKKCSFQNGEYENEFDLPEAYAIKHKNIEVIKKSRSGGAFTAFTDKILAFDGIIYGCITDDKYVAIHSRAINSEQRDEMRGAKYVQSNLKNIYPQIKKDLEEGKKVLFSGTSCQVAAIKTYFENIDTKNLIIVDLICHGVPSPRVWKDFLEHCEKRYHGKITDVEFRNKNVYGWKDHVESITVNEKRHDSRIYTKLFHSHYILRPSCFECPYKHVIHQSDITIGDCWGIDKACPQMEDNIGTSLVLVNNNKGKAFFDECIEDLIYNKVELKNVMQPTLQNNFDKPSGMEEFWNYYNRYGFEGAIKKYKGVNESLKVKLYRKLHYFKNS